MGELGLSTDWHKIVLTMWNEVGREPIPSGSIESNRKGTVSGAFILLVIRCANLPDRQQIEPCETWTA